jgi:hypothetical protein
MRDLTEEEIVEFQRDIFSRLLYLDEQGLIVTIIRSIQLLGAENAVVILRNIEDEIRVLSYGSAQALEERAGDSEETKEQKQTTHVNMIKDLLQAGLDKCDSKTKEFRVIQSAEESSEAEKNKPSN